MRNSHRERAILNIIQGFQYLRILPYDFKEIEVISEGGACWSRDTIRIKKPNVSTSTMQWFEDWLNRVIINYIRPHKDNIIEMDYMSTASPHEVYIEWVDELEKKSFFDLGETNA